MEELEQALLGFLENPPGTVEELVSRITPDVYARLKQAVALGRWAEDQRMSKEQVGQCMQLIILYEAQNVASDDRVGAPLNSDCGSTADETRPITVRDGGEGVKQ